MELKDETHVSITKRRAFVIVEGQNIDITNPQLSLRWSVQSPENMEQSALADSGGTSYRDGLALFHLYVDPAKHFQILPAAAVDLAHSLCP